MSACCVGAVLKTRDKGKHEVADFTHIFFKMHIKTVTLSDPVGWSLLELNQSTSGEWKDFC